jgi:4-amino-4-deoxy-L-arabinose transferase-like glycosyltransferase
MSNKLFTPAIIVIVTLAFLAPFLNKAFHMDDPLFLWAAKHIQNNPADFYGFSVNWYGNERPMYWVMKNPPLTSYYIAAATSVLGFSEMVLHTAFLLPAVASILGTYYLARHLTAKPALAAVLTLLTPAFLVSSTNIMCDTMMLSFWVWAIFLWIRGIKNNNHPDLFFSSVLIAICTLTKYFGVSLILLLSVYTLMKKNKPKYSVLYFLIPACLLAGYQWLSFSLCGRELFSDAGEYASFVRKASSQLFVKGLTGLAFTGGCTITVLFFSVMLFSKRFFVWTTAATILLIVILISVRKTDIIQTYADNHVNWGFVIQLGLMCATGAAVLWLSIADLVKHKNSDSLLLFLWLLGTFVFAGLLNWTVNARSVLPLVPAVSILIARRIDFKPESGHIRKIAWPLIASAAVSLLVCTADYIYAGTARQAAISINGKFSNYKNAVWFEGHWGFQYYMEALGGKALVFEKTMLEPGNIIIIPLQNTNIKIPPQNYAEKIDVLQFEQFPLAATMSFTLGAGFYTSIWGPLPYAIGKTAPEDYLIYRVKKTPDSSGATILPNS